MTAPDLRAQGDIAAAHGASASPTRLLASALLHVLGRDEPLPPRWRAAAFVTAVADHRAALGTIRAAAGLDALATAGGATFRGAMTALASDPHAVALAVRRLELDRAASVPAWPAIVRHGIGPRVTPADASTWFG